MGFGGRGLLWPQAGNGISPSWSGGQVVRGQLSHRVGEVSRTAAGCALGKPRSWELRRADGGGVQGSGFFSARVLPSFGCFPLCLWCFRCAFETGGRSAGLRLGVSVCVCGGRAQKWVSRRADGGGMQGSLAFLLVSFLPVFGGSVVCVCSGGCSGSGECCLPSSFLFLCFFPGFFLSFLRLVFRLGFLGSCCFGWARFGGGLGFFSGCPVSLPSSYL